MDKNKFKFIAFIFAFVLVHLIKCSFVMAKEYSVSIESVDNLFYGNILKDEDIKGVSDINGQFTFANGNQFLDNVGEKELQIKFTPEDTSYEVKQINYIAQIEKRKIGINFSTPIYKQYDGTKEINLPAYTLIGIIDNEVRVKGELIGEFSATYVGEGIPLVLSGLEIEGNRKNCYYIDFLEHYGRIHPAKLEKNGVNETTIVLDKNVYVDIGYSLRINKEEINETVNQKYTSFLSYSYIVYNHNHLIQDVKGNFTVTMKFDEEIINRERLEVFELTKDGKYKILNYSYNDGSISFKIASDSKIVFTTRNIEYQFIIFFSAILLFSLLFVIVYRIKNSKMKGYKEY